MGCRGGCGNNSCSCGVIPIPYYEDPCFQSNQNQGCQIFNQYSSVIRVSTGWAVPELGELITLKVAALADMLVGVLIWNPTYGSFEVVSYDQEGQLIKVRKTVANASTVGTVIPSCTKFIITENQPLGSLRYQEVTATGTIASDAALLVGNVVKVFGADNIAGVIMSEYPVGTTIVVYNDSADNLNVYPPTGGKFNNEAVNAVDVIAAYNFTTFTVYPNNQFMW